MNETEFIKQYQPYAETVARDIVERLGLDYEEPDDLISAMMITLMDLYRAGKHTMHPSHIKCNMKWAIYRYLGRHDPMCRRVRRENKNRDPDDYTDEYKEQGLWRRANMLDIKEYKDGYEHNLEEMIDFKYLVKSLASIIPNDRDRDIMLLYIKGWYLREIGTKYGITHQRVEQIIKKYIKLFKEQINAKKEN